MSSKLELASRVLTDLWQEFASAVFKTGPTGQTSITCGITAADGSIQTPFYLDPYAEGECAGVDWIVIIMLMFFVHGVSWLPRYLLWEPFANWRMQGFKTWDQSEARKFSQTATSLLFFCSSAFFVARILGPKDWIYNREGWAHLISSPTADPDFKFYYLLYSARFFSDSISIFFEDRKFDAFVAAFIHHWVTLGLVLGSAHLGHIGYGGIIMFFFDWADIPLLAAKLFKYLSKDPKDVFQFAANRLFELFAVCFLATRNCLFNYVVFWALHDLPDSFSGHVCRGLLILLVTLQTYWLYLVIMAVKRQKESGGNVEDVRETKED